jgi:hypothetical protein
MSANADDSIKQIIQLSRRLCACDRLSEQHSDYIGNLQELVAPVEVRKSLGLEQLTLWTICSREGSSSVIRRDCSGHIIIDGFQFLALSEILSSVVLSAGPAAATVTFLALMAEAFLRFDHVELAYGCKIQSLELAKRTPAAQAVTASDDHVLYLHYVQKLFVLGHELGHLILDAPDTTISSNLKKDIDVRLSDVRRYLRESASDDIQKEIDEGRWSLTEEDAGFRDELCCDTLSIEQIKHLLGKAGGMDQAMICEAIIVAALSLDILRLLRSVAVEESLHSGQAWIKTLLNRHFVRNVYLARLLSVQFGIPFGPLHQCFERFRWAWYAPGGMLSLFSFVEQLQQSPGLDKVRDEARSRIDEMCGWKADPNAVICSRVF